MTTIKSPVGVAERENEAVIAVLPYDAGPYACTDVEHQTDDGLRFARNPHPHGLVKRKYCRDLPEYKPTKRDIQP